MYYTSRSIKLATRYIKYLELIQDANNRYEEKRSNISLWQSNKSLLTPINYGFNRRYMERMRALSSWLVIRMQSVITELNEVNLAQLRKELSNETSIIEL